MTALPATTKKKLGLVIDLDTCVGCHACATSCKEWNTGGYSAPLSDEQPYGADPHGAWLNRVHSYEVGTGAQSRTVHFPRSCLHCETPACVTVCPTGASYKRAEDGIVLVNPDTCIGCKLCSWACPYGAREYDYSHGVMKKCTLCVDRIYNDTLERGGSSARLRPRLPDRRPPLRRSRRQRQRGLEAGCRAWRLRSAARVGLQADQQISAATAKARPADQCEREIGHRGGTWPRRLRHRTAVCLGRQGAVGMSTNRYRSTSHPIADCHA